MGESARPTNAGNDGARPTSSTDVAEASTSGSKTAAVSNQGHFWLPPPSGTEESLRSIRRSLKTFPSPALRVSRVGQLDAALLDSELETIISAPLLKALVELKRPGSRNWEAEMVALLRITVLKLSLFERGATYGSMLQNLKYRNEWRHESDGFQSTAVDSSLGSFQKYAYMSLSVLPSYFHARLRDRMLSSSWSDESLPRHWVSLLDLRRLRSQPKRRRRVAGQVQDLQEEREEEQGQFGREWKRVIWELLSLGEKLGAIAGLLNFLVFLYDGKYRTLVDRVLRMRLIYAQRSISRNVSFEFLNRQLVWEAFTEFLLFLMPLINLNRLRRKVVKILTDTTQNSKAVSVVVSALPAPVKRFLKIPVLSLKSKGAQKDNSSSTASRDRSDASQRPHGPLHFLPPTTCPVCYSLTAAPPTALPPSANPSDPASSTTALATLAHTASSNAAQGGIGGASPEDTQVRVPYITDCGWGCRYCYYCIVGKLAVCEEEGEDSWSCLRCGEEVRGVYREVDVVEDGLEDTEGLATSSSRPGKGQESDTGGEAGDLEADEPGLTDEVESEVESVASLHEKWRS